MLIDLESAKLNLKLKNISNSFCKIVDGIEWRLIPDYGSISECTDVIKVGDVWAILIAVHKKTILAGLFFHEDDFTLKEAIRWLTDYNIDFKPAASLDFFVDEAEVILCGVKFRGNSLVEYKRGKKRIVYNPDNYIEMTSDGNKPTDLMIYNDEVEFITRPLKEMLK